jgi:4-amino-4-deoxy-L-arabinose transferase-like glycosyltransferase
LLPLAVYLATACRTVYNLDSAEFSAAVHVLGIVRATGYPLYLLLGKAFAILLPVGDVGFRLNVMSALCGAATVLLLYHLARRLVGVRAAALTAALLFGFSYYFWAQAVVAEVYTLHTLLLCALLLLLLRWESSRADWVLAAAGLVYGLSLGNHLSSVLVAPGLAAFVLAVAGREALAPRRLLLLACPILAGLSVYAYLPLRYLAAPAFNYAGHYDAAGHFVPLDLTRLENLWWLVSGQGFRELMLGYTPAETVAELGATIHRLWAAFLGVGLLPGLLGAWAQGHRRPQYLLLFGLAFVANVAFYTTYRVVDKAAMFVPAYLIWAVWIAEGWAWIIGWLRAQPAGAKSPSPAWAWALTLLATVALLVNGPLLNVRDDTRARDRAEAILEAAEPQAIVFGWWTSAPPMQYLQIVEGQRPDVLVINRYLIGAQEMYTLIDQSLGSRPVYAVELDEGLTGAYDVRSVGPMFELGPRRLAGVEP